MRPNLFSFELLVVEVKRAFSQLPRLFEQGAAQGVCVLHKGINSAGTIVGTETVTLNGKYSAHAHTWRVVRNFTVYIRTPRRQDNIRCRRRVIQSFAVSIRTQGLSSFRNDDIQVSLNFLRHWRQQTFCHHFTNRSTTPRHNKVRLTPSRLTFTLTSKWRATSSWQRQRQGRSACPFGEKLKWSGKR
jgi:hypothetical protein